MKFTGFQAIISHMGNDIRARFDADSGTLSFEGLTYESAVALAHQIEGTRTAVAGGHGGSVEITVPQGGSIRIGGGNASGAPDAVTSGPAATSYPTVATGAVGGRPPPVLNGATIAAIAASNPVKAPAAATPRKRGKTAPADALPETGEGTVEEAAPAPAPTRTRRAAAPPPEPEPEAVEEEAPPGDDAPVEAEAELDAGDDGSAEDAPAEEALPEALTEAKSVRAVLEYFFDQGLTDPKELKEALFGVRDRVRCLSRIADLDNRVDRTLEVMDMGSPVT